MCCDLSVVVKLIDNCLNSLKIPYFLRKNKTHKVPLSLSDLCSIAKAVWYFNYRQRVIGTDKKMIIFTRSVSFLFTVLTNKTKQKEKN